MYPRISSPDKLLGHPIGKADRSKSRGSLVGILCLLPSLQAAGAGIHTVKQYVTVQKGVTDVRVHSLNNIRTNPGTWKPGVFWERTCAEIAQN